MQNQALCRRLGVSTEFPDPIATAAEIATRVVKAEGRLFNDDIYRRLTELCPGRENTFEFGLAAGIAFMLASEATTA